jgi:DNA polymerase-2
MAEFKVESALDIEFEKHYTKFFLPPARNGQGGAKKRYVGLLATKAEPELQFVGMEYVRSDWTKLAKKFQFEVFRRLFDGIDVEDWIRDFVQDIKDHKYDKDLVYKKRLTKDPSEYVKNIPPHVRAALQLEENPESQDPAEVQIRRKEISYVMTRRGPVPIQLEHNDIDYQHYIDKQIKPLADNVLFIFEKTFDDIVTGDQLSLF